MNQLNDILTEDQFNKLQHVLNHTQIRNYNLIRDYFTCGLRGIKRYNYLHAKYNLLRNTISQLIGEDNVREIVNKFRKEV